MKDIVRREGFRLAEKPDETGADFYIASAATSTEEIGNPVYPPARRKLAEHGIDCSGKHARQMRRSDYSAFDLLIGMDYANIRNMNRIAGGDPEGKIRLLLDFAGRHDEVADPWYTGDFESTWKDAAEGCAALLKYLADGPQAALLNHPEDSHARQEQYEKYKTFRG